MLLVFPCIAHGAVVISEIAWMGTAASSNNEWIELHNTGDTAVALDGWVLSDQRELSIELAGTIESHAYAVLERTDDATVAGSAFLIYTGSLTNEGTTLTLYREDRTPEDRVAGGDGWENIGGDNATKETAQRTDAGWRTAEPSPGEAPSKVRAKVTAQKDTSDTDDAEEPLRIELQLPQNTLGLALLVPGIAYVNQPVVFDVEPSGLGKTLLDSLLYTWNFGDLTAKTGKRVTHTFTYPGEYVVTLYGTFSRHEAVARTTITILPVTFSLLFDAHGDVLLQNNAKYEVNISDYTMEGKEKLLFPPRSVILPNSTIAVPRERLGSQFTAAFLYDQEGELVASTKAASPSDAAEEYIASATAVSADEVVRVPDTQKQSNFLFAQEVTQVEDTPPAPQPAAATLALAQTSHSASIPERALPLLGLCGIVTVGIIAVLLSKRKEE